MEKIDRYTGSLCGLAICDALGAPVEFRSPGSFEPVTDFRGGGSFGLKPGEWTDDTSMALCLADSLIECNGFDPADQLKRYVQWWQEGYLSCNGRCFDIGITTRGSLSKFLETGEPYPGPTDYHTAGNGSLMRLAPVPLFYASKPAEAVEKAGESSRTTHGAKEAVDACRYYASLMVGAIQGVPKETLLSAGFECEPGIWKKQPLSEKIEQVAAGSFKVRKPPEIRGSGYVVSSMEAALWAFYHSSNFGEGALMAVNLGDDADTTAAIYGQLTGAYYSINGIPEKWRKDLVRYDLVESFANRLFEASESIKS